MSNIANKLNASFDLLEQATASIATLKSEFAEYVKDQSIPLSERWAMFARAPDVVKHYEPWTQHLSIGGNEICWYDDFYIERGQDVDMVDIVERMVESTLEGIYSNPDVFEFQEMILSRNLGGFNEDW